METIAEFEVGDTVTFKPYEKACACRVISIQKGMWATGKYLNGEPDERIFYELKGDAVTKCSGMCIVESNLYEATPLDK